MEENLEECSRRSVQYVPFFNVKAAPLWLQSLCDEIVIREAFLKYFQRKNLGWYLAFGWLWSLM